MNDFTLNILEFNQHGWNILLSGNDKRVLKTLRKTLKELVVESENETSFKVIIKEKTI